jgi:iron complex transport system ATP-binding protein
MKLSARDLSFSFRPGRLVLQGLSFTVDVDGVVFILGHNGCGKSTLFNCLSGVYAPQGGCVLLDGADLAHLSSRLRAQKIGLVPQNHAAAFPYTVREMVLMGRAPYLGLFETPGARDYQLADEALGAVGLGDLAARSYNELSGGERRLAMIARGLAQDSSILLLDEPDAYLDPRNQHIVLETVTKLAQRGQTFVITSHAPNNALLYADRVLLMQGGRIMADGRPEAVLTGELLSAAYNMPIDVLYDRADGRSRPRAILPSRQAGVAWNGDEPLSTGGP